MLLPIGTGVLFKLNTVSRQRSFQGSAFTEVIENAYSPWETHGFLVFRSTWQLVTTSFSPTITPEP